MAERVVSAGPWETVAENLQIARRLAREWHWKMRGFYEYDDLYQVAVLGLYEGVISHKPGPDANFVGFLYLVARNHIRDHITALGWWARWSPGINRKAHRDNPPFSLDQIRLMFPRGWDVADPEDDFAVVDGGEAARDLLRRLIPLLDEQEFGVLWELVANGRTPKTIAPILGVTPARVSQVRQRIIEKTRTLGTYSVRDPSRECPKGHPLVGEKAWTYGVRGARACAFCAAARQRERQDLRRGALDYSKAGSWASFGYAHGRGPGRRRHVTRGRHEGKAEIVRERDMREAARSRG